MSMAGSLVMAWNSLPSKLHYIKDAAVLNANLKRNFLD